MGESGGRPISLPRLEAPEDLLRGDALVLGDGLDVARMLPRGCLDLVYLDPPFGAGTARRTLRGRAGRFGLGDAVAYDDPGRGRLSFPDSGGAHLSLHDSGGGRLSLHNPSGAHLSPWLADLLAETRRVLRPGGALFLHLDWRLAHHARVFLDGVFGEAQFLNEIVWHYATGGIPARWFARKHDTILYYRNGPGHTFHRQREVKRLKHRVARSGVVEFQDEEGWYRYRFLDDVWEIPWLTQDARERTGYPSQKPVALLLRILEATTDPGMRVADFCGGSGTTAAAAQRLGRRWISCDVAPLAVRIARERLEAEIARERSAVEIAPSGLAAGSVRPAAAPSCPEAITGTDFLVVEARGAE
jgi:site-specific DNA-methyltransferase (adenine-specific)